MKLGLIARADNTGLGMQTEQFYKHMYPHKTMVVDISRLNGNVIYPDRFPGATIIHGFPTNEDVDNFLQGLDVVFLAEAPYNFYLYSRAKELGVKVANQYNYEFFDWFANPNLPTPDMLIAPSRWHYAEVDRFCLDRGIKHVYLHCPVNREELVYRKNSTARTFLHVAGRAASHDRNGTESVIIAASLLESDARIIIHFQGEQGLAHQTTMTITDYQALADTLGVLNKVEFRVNEFENYAEVYSLGDVMILPRRYGGNCLPLNEALSVGMPVLMPDIAPNNCWLPPQWLSPATISGEFTPRTKIDIYQIDALALARKIDRMYAEGIEHDNGIANAIADQISWANMAHMYRKEFEDLCQIK